MRAFRHAALSLLIVGALLAGSAGVANAKFKFSPWPAKAKSSIMKSCNKNGREKAYCNCVIVVLENHLTYPSFVRLTAKKRAQAFVSASRLCATKYRP